MYTGFTCWDCRKECIGEYYMVHDEIWNLCKFKNGTGMLCLSCLEKRIGRALTKRDFTEAPINKIEHDNNKSKKFLDILMSD